MTRTRTMKSDTIADGSPLTQSITIDTTMTTLLSAVDLDDETLWYNDRETNERRDGA